jgi:peroxiredoxin
MRVLLAILLAALSAVAATIPRPAPEFEFKMSGRQVAKLSQWRGKVIVMEILLTTCPHCARTSQVMDRLQAEYAKRGVQALGVTLNDQTGDLTADYVRALGLKYPVGRASRDDVTTFLQHPPMISMMVPQLVFIDRKGMIRAQYPGTDPFFKNEEEGMRKMLDFLLKESGGTGRSK